VVSDASPTASTRELVVGLDRRKIAVEPRRARVALIVTPPLLLIVTRTIAYAPGFVVCGSADPLEARARKATEVTTRSANDLTKPG